MAANWKNSVENFSECYHCPGQHKGLIEGGLDLESYHITVHDGHHSHVSRDQGDASAFPLDGDHAAPRSEPSDFIFRFTLSSSPSIYDMESG
jgi:choline monooxygenase